MKSIPSSNLSKFLILSRNIEKNNFDKPELHGYNLN